MISLKNIKVRTVTRVAILVQLLTLTSYHREQSSEDTQLLSGITTAQLMTQVEGAESPERAALAMAAGVTERSPSKFLQHLCLGVCDGPISTINKHAECMYQKHLAD